MLTFRSPAPLVALISLGASLASVCTLTTDLDRFKVEGEGAGDCAAFQTFESGTDLLLAVRNWPVGEPTDVTVAVVGKPTGRADFEFVTTARLVDLQEADSTIRIPEGVVPGDMQVIAVQETNGEPGFQGGDDLSWRPDICSSGRVTVTPPNPNESRDLSEEWDTAEQAANSNFELGFIAFGGPHGGEVFQLVIESSERVLAYYQLGAIPDEARFFVRFPRQFLEGEYDVKMFADGFAREGEGGNGVYDPGGIDHSWELGMNVENGQTTVTDENGRIRPDDPSDFGHDRPFDQVDEGDWVIEYE